MSVGYVRLKRAHIKARVHIPDYQRPSATMNRRDQVTMCGIPFHVRDVDVVEQVVEGDVCKVCIKQIDVHARKPYRVYVYGENNGREEMFIDYASPKYAYAYAKRVVSRARDVRAEIAKNGRSLVVICWSQKLHRCMKVVKE